MNLPLYPHRGPGRLLLVLPVILLLAGKAFAVAFGVNVAALPMDFLFAAMLIAIGGYGFLIWRLTMNAHRAQLDERF